MSISPYINWLRQTKPFTSYTPTFNPNAYLSAINPYNTNTSPYGTGATTAAAASPYDPTGAFEQQMAALRAQLQGESAADEASAKAGIQRALIQGGFGFDKEAIKGLGYGANGPLKIAYDSKTANLIQKANEAGLTQSYKINQANTDANRAIINNLAARGILRSGDTGYTLGRQNTAFTQAQYGARQHILDVIAGIQAGYLAAERQRQALLAQAGAGA